MIPRHAKKNDVVKHWKVLIHVGLLFNKPPGITGLPCS